MIVVTRILICVCECLLRYMFAPLFGAYLQTFIQLFVAVLSIFNGLFGGLIGYTIAPIIGADTIHNNEFVKSLIALHIGRLTNFIGFNNGLSYPQCGGVILATHNIEMIGLFEALHRAFDTTNYGDIGHILSPYPIRNGVEFLGVFNEMNDNEIILSENVYNCSTYFGLFF